MADREVVFFTLGAQVYGLDVKSIQGIEKVEMLLPVPNTLSHIKGLINLRGEVIPIYSLRKKFGMPEAVTTEVTQLIITRLKNGIALALEVDSVREIKVISDTSESSAPALIMGSPTEYIEKVVLLDKGLAILINPDGVLTAEEKQKIEIYLEKLKKEEEKRQAESLK